ncbi:Myb/SANT-like domain-containing protein [Cynara cardunculus var. scolymus]|uniref:Myb/SANT-like domain-containing protein n=1 Tax=Cynara cardunculus var. scolymus TaxID=59895 RepID=A0A124SAT1_CYNCS|nr:Myb/SANT-like domain-containing protein [Cynara cardunculus var. scolymus]
MADRRWWTTDEEDLLITILQDIVINRGRGDNGRFRSGTYEAVVSKMREKIPGISLTAKHVQNKIKRLKDKYYAAYDMLNTSGFGWNDANQCMTVEAPEILEEYLKKHPNKNYTANKPFPAYERLKLVFGKDRATGNMAESATDALHNMNMEDNEDFSTEFGVPPFPSPSDPTSPSFIPPSEGEETSKKRKRTTELSKMVEATKNSIDEATTQMKMIYSVISDSTLAMDGLREELRGLGLGVIEIIQMGKYFADKPSQYRFWKSLDDYMKIEFVKSIYDEIK